jgi:uncharacterized lipoprotein YbaY
VPSSLKKDAAARGDVSVLVEGRSVHNATLVVFLEDVTLADAASIVVARYERHGIGADVDTELIVRFEMFFEPTAARLGLRALLDVDGDGRASRGDYVSVQSYPVDGLAKASSIRMSLRRID